MAEYGTARRKRIRRWKRRRVSGQKRLTVVTLCMGLIWLYAGLTATKGAIICYVMAAVCFWATVQEYKDIGRFKQAFKKKGGG